MTMFCLTAEAPIATRQTQNTNHPLPSTRRHLSIVVIIETQKKENPR